MRSFATRLQRTASRLVLVALIGSLLIACVTQAAPQASSSSSSNPGASASAASAASGGGGGGGLLGGVLNIAAVPLNTVVGSLNQLGLPSIATAPLSAVTNLFNGFGR